MLEDERPTLQDQVDSPDERVLSQVAAEQAQGVSSPEPHPLPLPSDWEHIELHRRVSATLLSLPDVFKTALTVTGIEAPDLFSFNSAIGSVVESQVVDALNNLRERWDPAGEYADYRFMRRSQTFPDVVLAALNSDRSLDILFGIELKGWYALAREGEPSFRYLVTPK